MNIKTKYDIGDRVEFVRVQETSGGKPIDHQPEVGIIERVGFDGKSIYYYMKSSYIAAIEEDWITYKLKGV